MEMVQTTTKMTTMNEKMTMKEVMRMKRMMKKMSEMILPLRKKMESTLTKMRTRMAKAQIPKIKMAPQRRKKMAKRTAAQLRRRPPKN